VLKSATLTKGTRFELDGEDISVGRAESGADIGIPNDFGVSAIHANIHFDGQRMILFDMDSVSGVHVNNMVISHGHFLNPGDKIRIGDTEFAFHRIRRRAGSNRPWWMEPDIITLIFLILLLSATAVYYFTRPPEPEERQRIFETLEGDEDAIFADNMMDWRSLALPENVVPVDNMEKAQMYYRQAMLCYRSKTLDLRNAFSAIVAMKRLKSCIPYEVNPLDLPFPFEDMDKVILGSQDYIEYQRVRITDGYTRARNIGDFDAAVKCIEEFRQLFVDKFSKVHAKEYIQGENELRWLYAQRD
jgi:pSer/pThr/pTyr-binding forkhead associated (FHA) protein